MPGRLGKGLPRARGGGPGGKPDRPGWLEGPCLNTQDVFHLLVIADAHHASCAEDAAGSQKRRCLLGCELIRRAIDDARCRGGFDAIALMGDLLNDGTSARAEADLQAIRSQIEAAAPGVPLMVVPGNHDGDFGRLLAAFSFRPGPCQIGGYRFFTFADAFAEGDFCTRAESDRKRFSAWARRSGPPIIALQHNPLFPPIEEPGSKYPYMLTNRAEVMRDYGEAGVLLSLSGHYHAGQPVTAVDGVSYLTVPTLCESPFRYALVSLRGRQVAVETPNLALAHEPPIVDCHVHTEFAYCASDVTVEAAVERARTFGLAGVCLVEHAPQLYCSAEDFWAGRHITQPAVWRKGDHSRMAEFRSAVLPMRSDFVCVGLEVEIDIEGRLTLQQADRKWADLIVGAIHWLARPVEQLSDEEMVELFMDTTRRILKAGVDVLAHPLRIFRAHRRALPVLRYAELAEGLARSRTAVEINFHNHPPDPRFTAECLRRRVKVAFGSDAHELREVGAFACHLAMLREAAEDAKSEALMFHPTARSNASGRSGGVHP